MKRKLNKKEVVSSEDGSSNESDLSDDFDGACEEANGESAATNEANLKKSSDGRQPPQKMAKLSKTALYKPPTNEELNNLKETENLFQSSLFRMQITELLNEVVLTTKRRSQVDEFLHKLKDVILSLPSQKQHEITDQKWATKNKFEVPFRQKPFKVKGTFRFMAPVCVKVTGSYLLGTCVRPDVHVDLALQLPTACFDPKDYLNQRYLRKRALYMTKMAILLEANDIIGKMSFSYHHGNHMKPILIISPAGKLGNHVRVHIHTCVEDAFKLNRFHIHKNNVRRSWYQGEAGADSPTSDGSADPPTPHYNTSILVDMVMTRHLAVIHQTLDEAQGVKDGLALLKVWLHQRRLSQGYGSFSGFIMTMFVVHLIQQRKLNKTMSSYQILRNTLLYLSQSDWTSNGVTMAMSTVDDHAPTVEDFHSAFDVVFVDPSGYVNLCSAMCKSTFLRVQHEAKLSLQIIDGPGLDSFEALFMKPVPFLTKFDQSFHVFHLERLATSALCPPDEVLDQGGDHVIPLTRHLLHLVDKAMSRRLHLVSVNLSPPQTWSVTAPAPQSGPAVITVGLLLDPDTAGSAVDKGPVADSVEAAEFRQFWGEKAELRRFQDGTIREAAVWNCSSVENRRFVPLKVMRHVLQRHGGISWGQVKYVAGQLDALLEIPSLRNSALHYHTGEEQHQAALQAYDQLTKLLRGLRDLPLAIHSIQGTSPALRHVETFPPLPATAPPTGTLEDGRHVPAPAAACPPFTPSMIVQCVLEMSGKWPDDVDAVRRLRAAFHVQLGRLLSEKHGLPAHPHPDHVLVLKDGYVFRVQIGYLREATLLKMVKTPEGMLKILETDESIAMEMELVGLPKMSSALHGLQQEHPSYSVAVRLAKRWISSQLLADHVAEEFVELLMAHLYLHPAPFSTPGSPLVAFQRWLHLVGNHDWQLLPIIVNLNNELTKKDYAEIESYFTQHRSTLPLFFVATPYDRQRSAWTRRRPGPQMARRLVLVARESLSTLQEQLTDTQVQLDYKTIFRPPLDDYDVLIHLNRQQVARRYVAVDAGKADVPPRYVTYDQASEDAKRSMPVVDYNPVQCYLKELRESFSEIALFFHDPLGGKYIAVLWKQPSLKPQPFKVSHIAARAPDISANNDQVSIIPNLAAVMEDFSVMGSGLVTTVQQLKAG